MKRVLPQSLTGQLILLVAVALLAAQAVNFALLHRATAQQNLVQASAYATARLAGFVDRMDGENADREQRAELRQRMRRHMARRRFTRPVAAAESAVKSDMERHPAVEKRAAAAFQQLDLPIEKVEAATTGRLPKLFEDRPGRRMLRREIARGDMRPRQFLIMSAKLDDGRWLNVRAHIPPRPRNVTWWLIGQTLILYLIVLIPIIWLSRRIAKPLAELTWSAKHFDISNASDGVVEGGPEDVRQLIVAFNDMRTKMAGMLDEKDLMLGAIGHDLRTPLAALRVRVESFEGEERDAMVAGIEEMDGMLEDILSLARIGKSSEAKQRVDAGALAQMIVDEFIDLDKDAQYSGDGKFVVPVRVMLIRRALRNLIDNAVKYGQRAKVHLEQSDESLHIHVDDDGPGIAERDIEAMLEPFVRQERSRNRKTGGSGLGLTLAKAIIVDHGGELRLVNRPEGGLRATLVLPL